LVRNNPEAGKSRLIIVSLFSVSKSGVSKSLLNQSYQYTRISVRTKLSRLACAGPLRLAFLHYGMYIGWYESGKRKAKALPAKKLAEHYCQLKYSQLNSDVFTGIVAGLPLFVVPVAMRVSHTFDLHPIPGPLFMRI
jgi:hypothetical protein